MKEFFLSVNTDQDYIFVILRSFILFIYIIFLIRFGNRRFQINTGFDYLLIVILGSLVSRGINGNASLLSTFFASTFLILFHRLIAVITFHSTKIEFLFKGKKNLIIKNGNYIKENLKKFHISKQDVLMQLRLQLHSDDIGLIKEGYLESSGRISFIKNPD